MTGLTLESELPNPRKIHPPAPSGGKIRRGVPRSPDTDSVISCCSPTARSRPSVNDKSLQLQVFRSGTMALFHDEPPLKCGGLHGHRGVHHEILCAVIQEEKYDWQALTAAALH